MKTTLFFIVILLIVAGVLTLKARPASRSSALPGPTPRPPLTDREQGMYNRLTSTFPHHVVLAQVSFSALLTSRHQAVRNTFNRKTADFVLCSRAFVVEAVIELDDSSHKGRERADQARQSLLSDAGYKVMRYANIPDEQKLLADFTPKAEKIPQSRRRT